MFKRFYLKDVVFLAIMSAALLLVNGMMMPVVMFTQLFALRQLGSAVFFGLFCTIALMKVPKPGALTLIGLFTGGVLLFMSPIMFLNNVMGALLTEAIILIIFRKGLVQKAVVLSAGLYVPLTLPVTLLATAVMRGQPLSEQLGDIPLAMLLIVGTVVLSFAGAFAGQRLGMEMKRAGKLS